MFDKKFTIKQKNYYTKLYIFWPLFFFTIFIRNKVLEIRRFQFTCHLNVPP